MNNGLARLAIIGVLMVTLASEAPAQWQIGARNVIDPSEPVLLTGYASRTKRARESTRSCGRERWRLAPISHTW